MDGMTSFVDQGLDVVFYNWRGVFAPLSTSAERREELKALMNTVTNTAAWQEQLANAMDGSQCSYPGMTLRPISLSRENLAHWCDDRD